MYGDGNKQLLEAMEYILTEEKASTNLVQFAKKDKISVIAFESKILAKWDTNDGTNTESLITNIKQEQVSGGTNIYRATTEALDILKDEDFNTYNCSIVLMTDGMSNQGKIEQLKDKYKSVNKDIPIYSIMFGDASKTQLQNIADLTNAKVFDGRTNLLEAFKQVRGYN